MRIMATTATSESVLAALRADLDIAPVDPGEARFELLAAVMRRLAGILCPCPRHALRQAVVRSLDPLAAWHDTLPALADAVIEGALTGGDLLELANVVVAEDHDHPTWLYCAPPGFVRGPGSRIYILGIAADGAQFLPESLRPRLRHQANSRFVEEVDGESLGESLLALGLREIRGDAWIHAPRPEDAARHLRSLQQRLAREGAAVPIEELSVLRPAAAAGAGYAGRWALPGARSGLHVGRFPGPYGGRAWCVVDLKAGQVQRFLRLPLPDSALAPSDAAWRAQLALDAVAGTPATYRVTPQDAGTILTSSFPLPRYVRQRFEYEGGPRADLAPYACWVPQALLASAKQFLQDQLWLRPDTTNQEER
jgi:hypothetical protein